MHLIVSHFAVGASDWLVIRRRLLDHRFDSRLASSTICPRITIALLAIVAIPQFGCFHERSFTLDLNRIEYVSDARAIGPRNTREWVSLVHSRLEHLLPYEDRQTPALLTETLLDANGKPVDVLKYFKKNKAYLHTFIGNLSGISQTAQVTGNSHCMDEPAPPWDGFEDIWIPISESLQLSTRIGWARRDGRIIDSDCIILLPGLLGDNMRKRAKDIGQMLVEAGHHVVSLEFRGHGQTEAKYPDVAYNFGTIEAGDLVTVAEWLESQPHVTATGVVSFSWSANLSLLAAWENTRADDHPSVSPRLKPFLRPRSKKTYFESGIFAISPVLDLEHIVDSLDTTWSMSQNPVLNAVQGTINRRAERRCYASVNGSLRRLIQCEFARSPISYPEAMADGFDYLRFLPYKGRPSGHKMQDAKVPILILHSASDPLAYAQEIADFFGEISNPNVAGIVLKGGGHDGFAAHSKRYFYSLMLNFFHPEYGARQARSRTTIVDTNSRENDTQLISDAPASIGQAGRK